MRRLDRFDPDVQPWHERSDSATTSNRIHIDASTMPVFWQSMIYVFLMLCLSVLYAPGVAAAEDDEWSWIVTPYAWAANTSADLTFNDVSENAQLDFSNILDKVELGGQLHIEASRGRWGGLLDLTYASVKDDETLDPKFPPAGNVKVGAEIETLLVEAAATYRVWGEPGLRGIDLLLGGRMMDVDIDLDIATSGPADIDSTFSGSETMTDAFAGARYLTPLGQRWELGVRGDVGTGDADIIWNGQVDLAYFLGNDRRRAIVAAYRYVYVEYDTEDMGNKLDAEITMSGPEIGFAFLF